MKVPRGRVRTLLAELQADALAVLEEADAGNAAALALVQEWRQLGITLGHGRLRFPTRGMLLCWALKSARGDMAEVFPIDVSENPRGRRRRARLPAKEQEGRDEERHRQETAARG